MNSTTTSNLSTEALDSASNRRMPGLFGRWLRFAVGLAVLLTFAFVVIPWLQTLGPAREVTEVIERNDIDAGGLFYTDVEETAEAEIFIRNSMARRPNRN